MESEKGEHRRALRADMVALWSWVEDQLSDEDKSKSAPSISMINSLLREGSDDLSWVQCNSVELLMLPLLPEPALDAQFRRRLNQAHQEGAISPERRDELVKCYLDKTPPATAKEKQEGCRTLLTQLHQFFVNRRFRRDQRLEAARLLLWLTGGILLIALVPILVFSLAPAGQAATTDVWTKTALIGNLVFCTYAAASVGILGALFSRLASFQGRLQTYGFEELLHSFSWRFIAVRCAVGMVGAIIFFLLMRSGLLGGSMFIEQEAFTAVGEKAVLPFAKLLAWSFIAGWSERLLPETLERTESAAKTAQEGSKTPR
jgi:hypothetical protein